MFCPGTFCLVYFVRCVLSGHILCGIFYPSICCPSIFCPDIFCALYSVRVYFVQVYFVLIYFVLVYFVRSWTFTYESVPIFSISTLAGYTFEPVFVLLPFATLAFPTPEIDSVCHRRVTSLTFSPMKFHSRLQNSNFLNNSVSPVIRPTYLLHNSRLTAIENILEDVRRRTVPSAMTDLMLTFLDAECSVTTQDF